jgi:hypothetical protein
VIYLIFYFDITTKNLYDIFYKRFDKKKYNRKEFINKNNVSVRKKKSLTKMS